MTSPDPDLEFVLLDEYLKKEETAIKNTDNIAESQTNDGGIERGGHVASSPIYCDRQLFGFRLFPIPQLLPPPSILDWRAVLMIYALYLYFLHIYNIFM